MKPLVCGVHCRYCTSFFKHNRVSTLSSLFLEIKEGNVSKHVTKAMKTREREREREKERRTEGEKDRKTERQKERKREREREREK